MDLLIENAKYYGYIKGVCQSTLYKIKHYSRLENKVNKVLSDRET